MTLLNYNQNVSSIERLIFLLFLLLSLKVLDLKVEMEYYKIPCSNDACSDNLQSHFIIG
jgi:hypothetical protein